MMNVETLTQEGGDGMAVTRVQVFARDAVWTRGGSGQVASSNPYIPRWHRPHADDPTTAHCSSRLPLIHDEPAWSDSAEITLCRRCFPSIAASLGLGGESDGE